MKDVGIMGYMPSRCSATGEASILLENVAHCGFEVRSDAAAAAAAAACASCLTVAVP